MIGPTPSEAQKNRLSYDDSIRHAHVPAGVESSYPGYSLPCPAISLCEEQAWPTQAAPLDASLASPFPFWLEDIAETGGLGPIVFAHGSPGRCRPEAWLEPVGCASGATASYLDESMHPDAAKANTDPPALSITNHDEALNDLAFATVDSSLSPGSSSSSNGNGSQSSSGADSATGSGTGSSSVSSDGHESSWQPTSLPGEPLDSLHSAAWQRHALASPPRLTKTAQDTPWPPGAGYQDGQLEAQTRAQDMRYSATAPATAYLTGLCVTEPAAWDTQPPLTDQVDPSSSLALCHAPANPTYDHESLQPPRRPDLDQYTALDLSLGLPPHGSNLLPFVDPYALQGPLWLDLFESVLYSPGLLSLPQVADMSRGIIVPQGFHRQAAEQQQQQQQNLPRPHIATLEPQHSSRQPDEQEQEAGGSLVDRGECQVLQQPIQDPTKPRLPGSEAVELEFDSESLDGFQLVSKRKRTEPEQLPAPAATDKDKPAEGRVKKTCLRCRVQKLRCNYTRDNSTECEACRHFSKTSRKTIHHIACYRGKLTATVLFRQGGLNLTKRWQGTDIKDVGDRLQNSPTRTIWVTLDLCKVPLVINVVPFCPAQDDVQDRCWHAKDAHGRLVAKGMRLPAYCLESASRTAAAFEQYVLDHALVAMAQESLEPRASGMRGLPTDLLRRTYGLAIDHYIKLGPGPDGSWDKLAAVEKNMLANLIFLWFATRHTTGSAYIIGPETLGMGPELLDQSYPLYNKVSLPRMVTAQFDSIIHKQILSKYGRRVLQDLEVLIFSNKRCYWWSIYVCVFIFLREASFITADRYRHARSNFGTKQLRYTIPDFVEELQDGCNNLLMHWHYYNCKPWPDASKPAQRRQYPFLSDVQCQLIRDTIADADIQQQLSVWKQYKENNGHIEKPLIPPAENEYTPYSGSQNKFDWDHPLYWVSQMFEEKWHPHSTYQREPVPPKPEYIVQYPPPHVDFTDFGPNLY
ncbi:hypothetical protein CDD81_6247 [Ophiocordyceps australis]|uniref:Zn(2)-C6 fungal-type domain-containing protein n=1 Tax=Ophiocordyceps australis TaxID=1399860 RepID=A0A2C5Y666_9HYPO|nr:hypothetical protein CDD81_6247 [Ophiocordyceps australis]